MVWSLRFGFYVASAVILVYTYNLDAREFPTRRMLNCLVAYWTLIVVGGYLGMVLGDLEFTSVAEMVMPSGLQSQAFVASMFHPRFGQAQDFLGFAVDRPTMPFQYTNNWGSNITLITPFLIPWAAARRWRKPVAIAAMAVAVVPIIWSLNRGLWITLALGIVYAAARQALRGQVRQLVSVLAVILATLVLVLATPLGDLVALRAEEGHSDQRRSTLYDSSLEAVAASPIVGHGGPVYSEDLPDDAPPAGTHGQIWLVLVPNGVPAAILFVAFFVVMIVRTWGAATGTFAFWANVAWVIALSQIVVYALLPSQLPVLMALGGLALRDVDDLRLRPVWPRTVGNAT